MKNAISFLNHGMRFMNNNNIWCMHTDSCNTVILIVHINWYDRKITHIVLLSLVNAVVFWCFKSAFNSEKLVLYGTVSRNAQSIPEGSRIPAQQPLELLVQQSLCSVTNLQCFFCNLVTYINLSGFNSHKFCIKFFFSKPLFLFLLIIRYVLKLNYAIQQGNSWITRRTEFW